MCDPNISTSICLVLYSNIQLLTIQDTSSFFLQTWEISCLTLLLRTSFLLRGISVHHSLKFSTSIPDHQSELVFISSIHMTILYVRRPNLEDLASILIFLPFSSVGSLHHSLIYPFPIITKRPLDSSACDIDRNITLSFSIFKTQLFHYSQCLLLSSSPTQGIILPLVNY